MRALLQQALDALEHVQWKNWRTDKAIQALRTELAKPEPVPVAYFNMAVNDTVGCIAYEYEKHKLTSGTPLFTKEQL